MEMGIIFPYINIRTDIAIDIKLFNNNLRLEQDCEFQMKSQKHFKETFAEISDILQGFRTRFR